MQFLADMGVSRRVTEWLRSAGHDVVHLRERGMSRLPDESIFRMAAAERRIVLTFDLDFGEIVARIGDQLASVILFRLRNTRSDYVIARTDAVLNESGAELSNPCIIVVEDARHRIRKLPIGS